MTSLLCDLQFDNHMATAQHTGYDDKPQYGYNSNIIERHWKTKFKQTGGSQTGKIQHL